MMIACLTRALNLVLLSRVMRSSDTSPLSTTMNLSGRLATESEGAGMEVMMVNLNIDHILVKK